MNRRLVAALIGATVLALGLVIVYQSRSVANGTAAEPGAMEEVDLGGPEEGAEGRAATLYFPNASGTLSGEERELRAWNTPEEGARIVAGAILAGPLSEELASPFPADTELGVTYLAPSALLYVDLLSSQHPRPPVTGSLEELLAVYSLVNSVLLSSPEIKGVVILWNGQQPQTFAGHLDTSLPLRADRDLIRGRG